MLPGPQPAQGLSPYKEKQGPMTLNKLLKNASTAKDPLTCLLNALLLSKEHGHHHYCKDQQNPSLYPSLERAQPHLDTPTAQSSPYQREQGNPLHR